MEKRIIFYMFSIVLGFGILIYIPINIISIDLSSYGKIEQTVSHIYAPSSPTSTQDLNLAIDVGDIEIKYAYPPINYIMKIDMVLQMVGINLSGKSFSDIFTVLWQNTNSSLNLTLFLKSNSWFDKSLIKKGSLEIILFLNADYLFNINTDTKYEGNFELKVPWNLSLNNVDVNITRGNIIFDFNHCVLEGNITGIVDYEDQRTQDALNLSREGSTRNKIENLPSEKDMEDDQSFFWS